MKAPLRTSRPIVVLTLFACNNAYMYILTYMFAFYTFTWPLQPIQHIDVQQFKQGEGRREGMG